MSLRRFQSLPPDRRAAILEAALAEFAEAGFDGASYNRIIKRAGLSKGAMYYYFEDKTDLCRTALEHAVEHARARIGPVDAFEDAAGFWAALHDIYRRVTAFLAEEPQTARVLHNLVRARDQAGVGAALAGLRQELHGSFAELLDRGVKLGAVRSDLPTDLLVDVVTAMGEASDVWLLRRLQDLRDEEIARYPDLAFALHRRVLEPDPKEDVT